MADDVEQLRLDLDDANARLAKVARLIQAKDDAEALVQSLTMQLRGARRRAKEAGWNLNAMLAAERRRSSDG